MSCMSDCSAAVMRVMTCLVRAKGGTGNPMDLGCSDQRFDRWVEVFPGWGLWERGDFGRQGWQPSWWGGAVATRLDIGSYSSG